MDKMHPKVARCDAGQCADRTYCAARWADYPSQAQHVLPLVMVENLAVGAFELFRTLLCVDPQSAQPSLAPATAQLLARGLGNLLDSLHISAAPAVGLAGVPAIATVVESTADIIYRMRLTLRPPAP